MQTWCDRSVWFARPVRSSCGQIPRRKIRCSSELFARPPARQLPPVMDRASSPFVLDKVRKWLDSRVRHHMRFAADNRTGAQQPTKTAVSFLIVQCAAVLSTGHLNTVRACPAANKALPRARQPVSADSALHAVAVNATISSNGPLKRQLPLPSQLIAPYLPVERNISTASWRINTSSSGPPPLVHLRKRTSWRQVNDQYKEDSR